MIKRGIYSSEFLLTCFTIASGLLAQYGNFIPPPWGLIVSAIVTTGYSISRGLAKQGGAIPIVLPPGASVGVSPEVKHGD